ncbi:MAG: hypothetical protein IRZ08_00665 [Frankia sp.]|nr:hypothetical protein [Frankia sp.]
MTRGRAGIDPRLRDVVFLVADGSMEQLLRGFFGRAGYHRTLGCGRFDVDPAQDVIVAARRDPEVYGLAHELLRPYLSSHARAVVMLDNDWKGSPGTEKIRADVGRRLAGLWDEYAVIVIDPELEAWIWQENPHVATALGCPPEFRGLLERAGHWPAGRAKPPNPKEALEYLRDRHQADRSKAVFRRLAARISVKGCIDPAFLQLRDTLRDWFPEDSL